MPNIAHQRLDCTVGCPVEGVLEIIGENGKASFCITCWMKPCVSMKSAGAYPALPSAC